MQAGPFGEELITFRCRPIYTWGGGGGWVGGGGAGEGVSTVAHAKGQSVHRND